MPRFTRPTMLSCGSSSATPRAWATITTFPCRVIKGDCAEAVIHQGLSGEAQTYAKMGKNAEAQDLLKKVLAANPKSVTDLQLSGELALNTDPNTAIDLLKRADGITAECAH